MILLVRETTAAKILRVHNHPWKDGSLSFQRIFLFYFLELKLNKDRGPYVPKALHKKSFWWYDWLNADF